MADGRRHIGRRRPRQATPTKRGHLRMYAGAKSSRLTMSVGSSSADAELATSLATLRNRSRALVRDVVFARRAKTIVVNNVIGPGVGLQGQVKNRNGMLQTRVNTGIEQAWREWSLAVHCHTGGELAFEDLERLAMGEVFEAGEVFIRKHMRPFGGGAVPLALELIEGERLADAHEITSPSGNPVHQGIERDSFGRPLAYYIHKQHPGIMRPMVPSDAVVRVPADEIMHLRLIDRWPQSRGVPALHAAINRLHQLGEFEEAAVIAARIGASKVGFFENPEWPEGMADGEEADGTPSMTVEAGEFTQLPPGYRFSSWDPNYPADTFDPFLRACLRGIAAGIGVSYESLSRDYSQSNYSSSRLALLDDRDLWRVLQAWWLRNLRAPLHRVWLQQAVFSGAIPAIEPASYAADAARFAAVKFKPRGWGWIDPTKEVTAYKEAERAGYVTKTDVIAQTAGGQDIEDMIATRAQELALLDEHKLTTDTTPAPRAPTDTPTDEPADDETERAAPLRAIGGNSDNG